MKPAGLSARLLLAALGFGIPEVLAWGELGHLTTGFLASHFVAPATRAYFQELLRDPTDAYLAGVATWADTIRYTKWGRFSSTFHFIDAKDDPPDACSVELSRDCKAQGCVLSALANYTQRLMNPKLDVKERVIATKFVVHFVADVHQPLHVENVGRGGNDIKVRFDGHTVNLHHVWDSSIAEKLRGIRRGGRPYQDARRWADDLAADIADGGRFASDRDAWVAGLDASQPLDAGLAWANQTNVYVCSAVFADGIDAVKGQDLGGDYYERAAPVVEVQVARAGYRLATWLDLIASAIEQGGRRSGHNDL